MEKTDTELLARIQLEMQPFKLPLSKASDMILDQGISEYPIFVLHGQEVEIGIPLWKKGDHGLKWSVHASTLEEFVAKQLITADKVENFKDVFKPPKSQLCCFVLSELGATFIFLPRI